MSNLSDFDLSEKWTLWFHKVNDNDWSFESYIKVLDVHRYFDLLFLLKDLDNITAGMFFLMREGIKPIFEDPQNIHGGYWSLRITKKESHLMWSKIIYLICMNRLVIGNSTKEIHGISVSPKINNCIFKIWNSDYNKFKLEDIPKTIDEIKFDEMFYLPHKP
jgi:hypothetical protein